jgi:hypothetical protein
MQENTGTSGTETNTAQDPFCAATNAICDGLRYLGDVSYAILPSDMAHQLGELKKTFLANVRTLIDKDIEWIDERVAGGDRLREEWKRKCEQQHSTSSTDPVN